MSNDLRWLIGSDFHIPYHNRRYMDLWWQVQKWFQPDIIDIAGDFDDQLACSRFSKGTVDEVMESVGTYSHIVKKFFADLRGNSKDAEIWAHEGNHDLRPGAYLDKNAPAVRDLITPELLWGLDSYGIELSHYGDPPVLRHGGMYVHHGKYALSKSGESVRKMLDDYNVSCIVGHSHRQGYVPKRFELRGETLHGYEIGHMTDVYSKGMSYDSKWDWQAGFAIGHIVGDNAHISLIGINDDFECVVDGKVFRG